jgi:phosphatidate cytidylyltransferase
LSGIVFVPVLIWISRTGGAPFLFLIYATVIMGLHEFYSLMEAKEINPSRKLGIAAVLVLTTLVFVSGTAHLGLFLAAFLLVLTVRELFRETMTFPIYDIATTFFGVAYVGWLVLHLLLLRQLPASIGLHDSMGGHFVLMTFFCVWSCDTAAFFVGTTLGKHKLLPRVSPKKSVEGAVGGFAASVGCALLARVWFAQHPGGEPLLSVGQAVIFGSLLGILGQLGDLVESLIKRDADVKDSSDTIPGHGGILDRLDSLVFSAPMAFYFLKLVVFR